MEVDNVCFDPENGFEVSGNDLLKYESDAVATWHTHPGDDFTANLTVADYNSFLNYPQWKHYIVAKDDILCYILQNGKVIIED